MRVATELGLSIQRNGAPYVLPSELQILQLLARTQAGFLPENSDMDAGLAGEIARSATVLIAAGLDLGTSEESR
jgi:hypothetical protein